jgi:hypothetical protein
MTAYHKVVDQLGGYFAGYSVEWIERKKNKEADALSRISSSLQPLHQASSSTSSTIRQSQSQKR